MFIALDKEENKITIEESHKGKKYFCPLCGSELIRKCGTRIKHHFAHKNCKDCDSWYNFENAMSEWHIEWQKKFPKKLREIPIENNIDKHRADIKAENLIIEFQHSPITGKEFDKRCEFYSKENLLIWLFDVRNKDIRYIDRGKRNFYIWSWAYKMLTKMNESETEKEYKSIRELIGVELFLQIKDDLIVRVDWNKEGLKYFSGRKFSNEEFIKYLRCKIIELRKKGLNGIKVEQKIKLIKKSALEICKEELEEEKREKTRLIQTFYYQREKARSLLFKNNLNI